MPEMLRQRRRENKRVWRQKLESDREQFFLLEKNAEKQASDGPEHRLILDS